MFCPPKLFGGLQLQWPINTKHWKINPKKMICPQMPPTVICGYPLTSICILVKQKLKPKIEPTPKKIKCLCIPNVPQIIWRSLIPKTCAFFFTGGGQKCQKLHKRLKNFFCFDNDCHLPILKCSIKLYEKCL